MASVYKVMDYTSLTGIKARSGYVTQFIKTRIKGIAILVLLLLLFSRYMVTFSPLADNPDDPQVRSATTGENILCCFFNCKLQTL